MEDPAVTTFREYLRIPSVHPNVNYDGCVEFIKRQAAILELPVHVYTLVQNKPVVVITWSGVQPSLPSILLNSHMDVVPAYPDKWKHAPFAAEKDSQGNIYARGAQDMKNVGVQYLEAIRRLKQRGVSLQRTVHVTFVPDEEIGGKEGMKVFVDSDEFKKMNVGFALDEGAANPTYEYLLVCGERSAWNVLVHCPGQTGHGCILFSNTAGEKLRVVLDRFMDFRQREKDRLDSNPDLNLGDVTTVNLTEVKGGVQANVVPPEFVVGFDVRVAPDVDHEELEATMQGWCREAGEGTHLEFKGKNPRVINTKLDDTNPFWVAFKQQCDQMQMKLKIMVLPGATDARFLRAVGIPALGFSPMNHTPTLLHDHDEFINEKIFLQGIDIYERIITAVANV